MKMPHIADGRRDLEQYLDHQLTTEQMYPNCIERGAPWISVKILPKVEGAVPSSGSIGKP
jgi:hypothetical protein